MEKNWAVNCGKLLLGGNGLYIEANKKKLGGKSWYLGRNKWYVKVNRKNWAAN